MYGAQRGADRSAAIGRGTFPAPTKPGRFPVVLVFPGARGPLLRGEIPCPAIWPATGSRAVVVELFAVAGDDALAAYSETSDREVMVMLEETYEFLQSDDVFWALAGEGWAARYRRRWSAGLDRGRHATLGGFGGRGRPPRLRATRSASIRWPTYLGSLPVAVLGLYGESDQLIDNDTVDEAQNRNGHGTWLLYEGAGHDFWNEESPEFDSGAGADMSARLLEFFRSTSAASRHRGPGLTDGLRRHTRRQLRICAGARGFLDYE